MIAIIGCSPNEVTDFEGPIFKFFVGTITPFCFEFRIGQ
jgi:hypothetical protein